MNTWYLLPGMGADSSMYNLLREEVRFPVNFIDWPSYRGEKTFAEVAKRVIEENGIKDGDIVGGSSLGGMVAIEMARRKSVKAVVLLGSAVNPAELNGFLSLFSPLVTVVPISFIQVLAGKSDNAIAKMFTGSDPEFIRAMSLYMRKWQGLQDMQIPLFRVHGEKDRVIICPKTGCEIIAHAGHFMAMTHTKECGAFLNKIHLSMAGP